MLLADVWVGWKSVATVLARVKLVMDGRDAVGPAAAVRVEVQTVMTTPDLLPAAAQVEEQLAQAY